MVLTNVSLVYRIALGIKQCCEDIQFAVLNPGVQGQALVIQTQVHILFVGMTIRTKMWN
jgi:hypothetical protein